MTGETTHAYAINTKAPTSTEKDSAFEHFGNKDAADSKSSGVSDSFESALIGDKTCQLNGREKETHSQREAVIRPQQAGKIDFKSLHNRSKFSSEATWTNGKSSPLSPTGKSRGKDKNKRSGKGDRNQHQLYRLSISSSRSNPTIGIAYPQQKVTPPKKVEVSQGPVSGSYRFHVPSIPEREAELHQEDLNFNRSLPEPSPSLTSTNYTSQTAQASRIHHGLKIQPGNVHDTANNNGQLHYLEFQPNGNTWHPSDKHFPGASGYNISNQKLCAFPEGNKSDSHSFVPVSFQYPFPSLQEPTGNSFCNNGNNQDFVDVALAANQVAHSTFFFQSSSREGPEDQQGNGTYNTVLSDSRTYGLPSQQAPFLHAQQGVQHPSTPPCYTGRNEHSADHSGAISSSGALTSSGAIEQTQSTFQENQSVFNPSEFSLHSSSMPALINKRQQPSKDFVHSQRLLAPGNTLRRNIPQTSLNKVHFPGKVYSSVNTGSVPFDKSLSRIPQTWDAGSNSFPPLDQNSVSYPNASGNLIPYQCQPSDQRQALKNPRMPWQESHITSSTANQNSIELSRHIGNQKLPYSLSNQDWQNNNLMPKIPPSYHTKKHPDTTRQSYSTSNDIMYDSVKDTNSQMSDSRAKGISYGMSQPIQQSRNNANQPVPLSGKTFVAESPCESPLPSPVNNHVSGSTCSSLSPMSSSPVNPSSDENQVPPTLTSSPYFHQPCHPTEKSFHPPDSLSSGSLLYHNSEPTKNFNYLSDASKDEQAFKNLQEIQYQKLANEPSKGCLDNFESEPPPPYSSHHFLASSLSSANLDQLDVLLTCKQCDQNFGNLSSFLEHRQYCNLNSTLHNEMKDPLHGGDLRKFAADPLKTSQTIPGLSIPKGQMEFHSHLVGFNKDYLLDSDAKGDTKEDHMKSNIFNNVTPSLLPLTACDTLEMDDAKLDSLIIEALNGLEFQVDNPEIDSNFIDVFVDDDLAAPKATVCSQPHKVKEYTETKNKLNTEEKQAHHNQISNTYEEQYETEASHNQKNVIKMRNEQKITEVGTAHRYSVNTETRNITQFTDTKTEDRERQKTGDLKKCITTPDKKKNSLNKTDFDYPDDKGIKYYDSHQGRVLRNDPQDFSITDTPKSRKTGLQDIKKKKTHNGTWSKELIHKIVQQKNKLHKLHVKSNKNVQFSLVTERLFPTTKSHPFGEYDYISDSDEEVAATSLPGKMPNGRLKYSFNRDLQGRGGRTKVKEPVWHMGEATRFQLQNKDLRSKNKDTSNRIRRRSSQSSNSSDQSTSISSETGSSPKSTERTDSENEQESVLRCKSFTTCTQNTAAERNLIKPLHRENPTEKLMHADFSKGTKRFGSAKFLLASSKVYPSKINDGTHYGEKDTLQHSTDSTEDNTCKTSEVQCFKNAGEEDRLSTYQEVMEASTLSQDNYTPDLILDIHNVPQQLSSFHADNTNYQEKRLNSSSCAPAMLDTEVNPPYSDSTVKYLNEALCNGHKDFQMPMPCYSGDSTVSILPQQNQKSYSNECQQLPDHKDVHGLYGNNIFSKAQNVASTNVEQIYVNQDNSNNMNSFENKCSDVTSYPSDNNDKVSSSLSFDSSSIFAELPISDFESPLYNSITPSKDNYVDFDQPSKQTHFEHQFPEFLRDKNWDLIGESAPMSSNNVSPFQVLESQATEKYAEHIPVSSKQMHIDMPRTITDYNVPFMNNMSEDELEIKRLVTELENQLQTSKVQNDAPSQTLSKHRITPELTDSSLTFPGMEVNTIEIGRKHEYFNENPNNVNDMKHAMHTVKIDHLQDSQPLIKVDDSCENLKRSWACSVQFDSFNSGIQCQKEASMLESFTTTETCNQYQSAVSDVCLTEELECLSNNQGTPSVMPDASLPNLSSQMERQTYSDHDLLRETLVTAETFSQTQENKDKTEKESQQNYAENLINKQQKLEDQFDDPPELEPFQSVSEMNSEFGLQDDSAPVLNITETPEYNNSASEEPLCNPILKSTIPQTATDIEYSKKHIILDDKEGSQKNNMSQNDLVLLDMPVLVKEESAIPEKPINTEESAENPLQQLQLFVARTAKNNEEEMLMPCFPMLLAASGAGDTKPEMEGDISHIVESTSTSKGESEIDLTVIEQKGMPQLIESCTPAMNVGHLDTSSGKLLESMGSEVHSEDKQSNHLEKECSGMNVINVGTGGTSKDHDNPRCESRVTEKLPQGQVQDNKEMTNYGDSDGKKSSFIKKQKSTSSSHMFDNDTCTARSMITPKVLDVQELSPDKQDTGCPLPDALDIEVAQMSQNTKEDQETQNVNNEVSVFTSPENHHQHMDILKETELFLGIGNTKDTSVLSEDNCGASDIADKSSTPFPLHTDTKKGLCNSHNQYDTHLHDLSIPTAHSMLRFDLLPSLKATTAQQKLLLPSTDDDLTSIERDALSTMNEVMNPIEQELVKHPVGATDVQLFVSEDKCLTSSLEAGQKMVPEKNSVTPIVEGHLTPCFCSELVCPHYKDQQADSVADIILGCQSIPANDTYTIYAGEDHHNFSALQNELFPESMQTPVGPSLSCQKEETLKCDWNNTHGSPNMEHVFPSEECQSTATICDLMDIVNFDCHQKTTEKTAVKLVTCFNNTTESENNDSNDEPGKRCTNDMHSVIDGVLRILGDKSKEILQSIGMSPKSSPIKENKSAGLSLTCDICSVSFRSKPGLTRHRAVKHNGSVKSRKDGVISDNPLNAKNKISEWNCSNDSQQNINSDTTSQNIIADFLNPDCNLQSHLLIPDEERRPLPAKTKGEKRPNGQFEETSSVDAVCKKKVYGKVKKRKVKLSNKSTDSQVPPDEVLNILKTNILKAIGQSNTFNSSEEKISWEESSDKDIAQKETALENVSLETYSAAISIDEDEKLVSDVLELEMNGERLLNKQTWTKSLEEHVEHIINDCEIQPEKGMLSKDHTLLTREEEHLNAVEKAIVQKDVQVPNLPKETVTYLHTFFDDDNTFSQLFPRDDNFIRRKCTRVYGKRSKKQTSPFEADLKHVEMVEHCHSSKLNYTCDPRSVSIDSTLMDSRNSSDPKEHLALYDHASPPKETIEVDERKILSFVSQSQPETMNVPLLIEGIQDEKDRDVSTHVSLYKPSGESLDLSEEISSDPRDPEVEDTHNYKINDETGLPEFPTIDMKMLSAKFDMRELSFFSACGDGSDQSDLDTPEIMQKTERRKKHAKNKMDDKKQVRNRNNVKMKTKDKQYKCKVCFQWFLTLGELDFHKLTHNPSPPPTCYMCVQRKFSSREQLRDHLKEKHAKNKAGLWICGMCLKEISDVWMYNEHLREHATQFARKGQAQKSVMGIPGCFGEESMVRTFLSTFIYRTPSKLSKTSEADDKSPVSKRQDQKEHKDEGEVVSEKEAENSIHVVPPAPIHVKLSVSPALGSIQKSDIIHKNAAMHPHCKDPSRDCHHCGKQFPKPFKLQRHLVVHSLQKIYLCHRCPKSYQEVQELRSHLTSEHQLAEKLEIKHTTLYACELCADVMHVIKKSFICSTCNYTFSKKEQYDRHMEKHLIGGSMTFKFRGVTRPTTSGKDIKERIKDYPTYESMPPAKKQKTSNYSDTSSDIASIDYGNPPQCPKLSPGVVFDKKMEENLRNEYENAVKIEDMLMDAPELHAEGNEEQIACSAEMCSLSPKPCEVNIKEKEDDEIVIETLPMLDVEMTISSFCAAKNGDFAVDDGEYTEMKEMPTHEQTIYKQVKETDGPPEMQTSHIEADNDLSHLPMEETAELFPSDKMMSPSKDTSKEPHSLIHEVLGKDKEDTPRSLLLDGAESAVSMSPKEKSLVTDTNSLAKDLKGLKKNKSVSQLNGRSATQANVTPYNGEDVVKSSTTRFKAACSLARDNSVCTMKETTASQQKLSKKEQPANIPKNNTDCKISDKVSTMPPKLNQKKRKEHKVSSHKGNTASQENLAGEVKKKTNKVVVTGKSESSVNVKKPEWVSSLSDTKDEALSSRSYPKPHAGGISGQFKKVVLDTHNQKKVNSQSSNGEYKCKKALLTKTLHPFSPKSSALSLNSPSHKRKMGHNTKPTEPSNYRTAESQNNLLSQLFGQKLTSFKIPLRRDITE